MTNPLVGSTSAQIKEVYFGLSSSSLLELCVRVPHDLFPNPPQTLPNLPVLSFHFVWSKRQPEDGEEGNGDEVGRQTDTRKMKKKLESLVIVVLELVLLLLTLPVAAFLCDVDLLNDRSNPTWTAPVACACVCDYVSFCLVWMSVPCWRSTYWSTFGVSLSPSTAANSGSRQKGRQTAASIQRDARGFSSDRWRLQRRLPQTKRCNAHFLPQRRRRRQQYCRIAEPLQSRSYRCLRSIPTIT